MLPLAVPGTSGVGGWHGKKHRCLSPTQKRCADVGPLEVTGSASADHQLFECPGIKQLQAARSPAGTQLQTGHQARPERMRSLQLRTRPPILAGEFTQATTFLMGEEGRGGLELLLGHTSAYCSNAFSSFPAGHLSFYFLIRKSEDWAVTLRRIPGFQ